jgi:hypothetical protein
VRLCEEPSKILEYDHVEELGIYREVKTKTMRKSHVLSYFVLDPGGSREIC